MALGKHLIQARAFAYALQDQAGIKLIMHNSMQYIVSWQLPICKESKNHAVP